MSVNGYNDGMAPDQVLEVLDENGEIEYRVYVWAKDSVRIEVEAKDSIQIEVVAQKPAPI